MRNKTSTRCANRDHGRRLCGKPSRKRCGLEKRDTRGGGIGWRVLRQLPRILFCAIADLGGNAAPCMGLRNVVLKQVNPPALRLPRNVGVGRRPFDLAISSYTYAETPAWPPESADT